MELDRILGDWVRERRPSRPGVELGLRSKELAAAASAVIPALALIVMVFIVEGELGPFQSQNPELVHGKHLLPFLFGLDHLFLGHIFSPDAFAPLAI
jgi:hypothetical protein